MAWFGAKPSGALCVLLGFWANQYALSLIAPQFTLQDFARTSGSLDASVSSVTYYNGSVFGKQPGNKLVKLFNFDGFNINRFVSQDNGSYTSLSRQFLVYRNPDTATILRVWMNPWTSEANEVFFVADDPVDAVWNAVPPVETLRNDIISFETNVILEYPNPLSPSEYSNYSAGPFFDSTLLTSFFTNETYLTGTMDKSVPMIGCFLGNSPYLPWMVMGDAPGRLYYSAMAWKCMQGLNCVPNDIMQIVHEHYSEYETAPTSFQQPNEDTWMQFKKEIDARRSSGLPDIIIPQLNSSGSMYQQTTDVDKRILDVLYLWPLSVRINATFWSEIPGNQSIALFNALGSVGIDLEPIPESGGYRLQLDGYLDLSDPVTGRRLSLWTNPITGKSVFAKNPAEVAVDLIATLDSFYSIDIPAANAVGLVAAQSYEGEGQNTGNWSINMANLVFEYSELMKFPNKTQFYGSAVMFSNWFSWMEMDDVPGNLVMKTSIYNLVF